jgi:uncharacterized repeat protein (TIGR01451 family)
MRTAALALAGLLALAVPATADLPAVNGRIAYDQGGNPSAIWTIAQDGYFPRKLANGREPAWSHDGTALAYVTGQGDTAASGQLALMNADGSNQRIVDTDLGPNISRPSFSPDGTQVVVAAFGDLYVVPLAGGRSRLLVADGDYPVWSPDGSLIAFVRNYSTIMLVRPDGSGLRDLTANGAGNTYNRQISWSPDSKRIAFTSGGYGGIDAIAVDGTGLTRLVPYGQDGFTRSVPAWSPDGSRIAFLENADLCTADADGSGSDVARLTYTPISQEPPGDPAWQPLPPGSTPAGLAGRVAGPAPGYPTGTPWYPSCDHPDDLVEIAATGPPRAKLGSWVTYTVTVTNRSHSPIGPVIISDVLSWKVPGRAPSPSQGRCGPFQRSELPGRPPVSECEVGGLLSGYSATIKVRLRMTKLGTFVNTAIKNGGAPGLVERTVKTRTRVVR